CTRLLRASSRTRSLVLINLILSSYTFFLRTVMSLFLLRRVARPIRVVVFRAPLPPRYDAWPQKSPNASTAAARATSPTTAPCQRSVTTAGAWATWARHVRSPGSPARATTAARRAIFCRDVPTRQFRDVPNATTGVIRRIRARNSWIEVTRLPGILLFISCRKNKQKAAHYHSYFLLRHVWTMCHLIHTFSDQC
ncbi:hypothetical protein CPB85DRAFT_308841, partial [Mucidula mucida]